MDNVQLDDDHSISYYLYKENYNHLMSLVHNESMTRTRLVYL